MKVKEALQDKYSAQYKDESEEWRMIGGEGKAKNIIKVASKSQSNFKVLDVGKKRNLETVKEIQLFDGYELPFEDDFFDVSICSHVIEHVEFPRTLIREISRVSKEQIFEVPIDFSFKVDKKVRHFLSYGHINIYSPQTFRFFLMSESLDIINYHNSIYEEKVFDYLYKDKSFFFKLKHKLKRSAWKMIPFLMRLKPNAITVRTQKSANPIAIMQ